MVESVLMFILIKRRHVIIQFSPLDNGGLPQPVRMFRLVCKAVSKDHSMLILNSI